MGLPFNGRAHFDSELEAWVGLSLEPHDFGRLCSGDVNVDLEERQMSSAVKLSKEKLLSDDGDERHFGATLIHMGGRSY